MHESSVQRGWVFCRSFFLLIFPIFKDVVLQKKELLAQKEGTVPFCVGRTLEQADQRQVRVHAGDPTGARGSIQSRVCFIVHTCGRRTQN